MSFYHSLQWQWQLQFEHVNACVHRTSFGCQNAIYIKNVPSSSESGMARSLSLLLLIHNNGIYSLHTKICIYLWVFALQCRKQELTTFSDFDSSWESVLHVQCAACIVHNTDSKPYQPMFSFWILFLPCHFNAHAKIKRILYNTEIMMQINCEGKKEREKNVTQNKTLAALVDFILRATCIATQNVLIVSRSLPRSLHASSISFEKSLPNKTVIFHTNSNRFFLTISTSNCNRVLIHTMS